jgi:type II secretory pathway pseudopilin PulG
MNIKTSSMKKQKGYTLMEAALVVAVIGVLTYVIIIAFANMKDRPRDASLVNSINSVISVIRDTAAGQETHALINTVTLFRQGAFQESWTNGTPSILHVYVPGGVRIFINIWLTDIEAGFNSSEGTQILIQYLNRDQCRAMIRLGNYNTIHVNGTKQNTMNTEVNKTAAYAQCVPDYVNYVILTVI